MNCIYCKKETIYTCSYQKCHDCNVWFEDNRIVIENNNISVEIFLDNNTISFIPIVENIMRVKSKILINYLIDDISPSNIEYYYNKLLELQILK